MTDDEQGLIDMLKIGLESCGFDVMAALNEKRWTLFGKSHIFGGHTRGCGPDAGRV